MVYIFWYCVRTNLGSLVMYLGLSYGVMWWSIVKIVVVYCSQNSLMIDR